MSDLWLRIVDSNYNLIPNVNVRIDTMTNQPTTLRHEEELWKCENISNDQIRIYASADGFEPEMHVVALRDNITQVVVGLRRPGEISYNYGNDRLAFQPIKDSFLLNVRGENAQEVFEATIRQYSLEWAPVSSQGLTMSDDLFVRVFAALEAARELLEELRRQELTIQVSRVISHGERPALGLTNELVARFQNSVSRAEAERLSGSVGLQIIREIQHAGNAFLLEREGEPSYELLDAANALMRSDRVVYVEPNLQFAVELDAYTPNDLLWSQVPHLQLIDVDDAWDLLDDVSTNLRGGSPNITIGVIDPHGIAPDHLDLTANLTDGTSKLVTSMNFAASPVAAQTVASLGGDHGTQCAASATAAFDDNRGIPGVAPNCHLVGARIGTTNAVLMSDIYLWVGGFLNGSTTSGFPTSPPARPADVISSSWGSNGLALSNTIRDCFDFLTTYGRSGKGCVLCFSLGNNGYIDYTNSAGSSFRAWPTYEKTLGVGASINTNPTNPVPNSTQADPTGSTTNIATAVDTRSLYSPYGATALRKPDLVSPSHTAYSPALVDPILSAVRVGTGSVDGCPGAPVCNDYASSFGGTSHATPTVAGAVALILSAQPDLNWVQVREILRQSCARIDAAQTNAIGQWQDLDSDGLIDYSRWYGAGRLDVDAAINLALDASLPLADIYVRENLSDTGTVPSGGSWWASPDIWVRQDATTPIPSLSWGTAPPHQNARRGQDNAVFCRVRNRGAAAAPTVYVRAMITHWAGLEFVYPDDFQPSNNVGAPIPSPLVPGTYLIGENRIDNLAPMADQIVKFTWPQALIPPETVTVSGATVNWHPCLLVEASPHDGPTPVGGLSIPVQGNNNIAQRNIQIENAGDADADLFVGMIAGTRDLSGVATLIVDATQLRGATAIRLHVADDDLMQQLFRNAVRVTREQLPSGAKEETECCAVVVEKRTVLRFDCGPCESYVEVAPGSRILSKECRSHQPIRVNLVKHYGADAVDFQGLRGQIEIPLRLREGQFVPLLVAVVGPGIGDLRITQRRGDGEISAGYGIRRISN